MESWSLAWRFPRNEHQIRDNAFNLTKYQIDNKPQIGIIDLYSVMVDSGVGYRMI